MEQATQQTDSDEQPRLGDRAALVRWFFAGLIGVVVWVLSLIHI